MKSDMKQIVILVVSFVLGLVAFGVAHVYLKAKLAAHHQLERDLAQQYSGVRVAVAARDLPQGSVLQVKDLARKSTPKYLVGAHGIPVEQMERIVGKKLLYAVKANQPILWPFLDATRAYGRELGTTIRKELRAISISAGGTAGVSGHLRQNDRVDVLGTFMFPSKVMEGEMEAITMTMLQNVTILAIGTQSVESDRYNYKGRKATGYSSVVLEVTPKEAELLVFAENMKGQLTLSLRNPTDMDYLLTKELESVNFNDLETKIPDYNRIRQETIIQRRVRYSRP
jgi:pilus assembly protein CpaB